MNLDRPKLCLWSPHNACEFVVLSEHLRLFRINSKAFNNKPKQHLADQAIQATHTTHTYGTHSTLDLRFPSTNLAETSASNAAASCAPSFSLIESWSPSTEKSLKCVAFSPQQHHSQHVAVGLISGEIQLLQLSSQHESTRLHSTSVGIVHCKSFVATFPRSTNCLHWNSTATHLLAVGLDRQRHSSGTLIWNVEQQGIAVQQSHQHKFTPPVESLTSPVSQVCNSEAALSLQWLPQSAHELIVGTNFKWLRIFDIRQHSERHSKPLSVFAHNKGVQGCKFDPNNDNRVATFSEDGLIKIFDKRCFTRGAALVINTANTQTAQSTTAANTRLNVALPVVDIEWSPLHRGIITSISKDESVVRHWDMSGHLIDEYGAELLQQVDDTNRKDRSQQTANASRISQFNAALSSLHYHPIHKQRLLTVTQSGECAVTSIQFARPLAWSIKRNHITLAGDKQLLVCRVNSLLKDAELSGDIASVMQQRAEKGYGLEANLNIALLNNECISGVASKTNAQSSLIAVWQWIQQQHHSLNHSTVQQCLSSDDNSVSSTALPFQGIITSLFAPQYIQLIHDKHLALQRQDKSSKLLSSTIQLQHIATPISSAATLQRPVFISPSRSRVLNICQWADSIQASSAANNNSQSSPLETRLAELEAADLFESAALLAVFHFQLDRARDALLNGARSVTDIQRQKDLFLCAMALAGQNLESSLKSVAHLPSSQARSSIASPLLAIFTFLTCNIPPSQAPPAEFLQCYTPLLNDNTLLNTNDQCAFACRFLSDQALTLFMEQRTLTALTLGQIDSLPLIGLQSELTIDLLQSYIDRTCDVQTAALLLCYHQTLSALSPFHSSPVSVPVPDSACWLESYKTVLNRWQMWHQRARLDVARAQLLMKLEYAADRLKQSTQQITSLSSIESTPSLSSTPEQQQSNSSNNEQLNPPSSLLPIPPQIFARCHFCGKSLSAASMHSARMLSLQREQQLSLTKTKNSASQTNLKRSTALALSDAASTHPRNVAGCPACKKSLPRCAICLLPCEAQLTAADSYTEAQLKQKQPDSPPTHSPHSLDFNRWFTWCASCQHGGHEQHLELWFTKHDYCPVTDCQCRCNAIH